MTDPDLPRPTLKQLVLEGSINNIAYAPVPVASVTVREQVFEPDKTYTMPKAIEDLSRRGAVQRAAMIDSQARQDVMRHSMRLMLDLRKQSGQRHTIIAQAKDIGDAERLTREWRQVATEFPGQYRIDFTHHMLDRGTQAEVKAAARSGELDVLVHVSQISRNFNAPALSIVAMFMVIRNMQRLTNLLNTAVKRKQGIPEDHPANVAYLVAHPLLGYHKHWRILCAGREPRARELAASKRTPDLILRSSSVHCVSLLDNVQLLVDVIEPPVPGPIDPFKGRNRHVTQDSEPDIESDLEIEVEDDEDDDEDESAHDEDDDEEPHSPDIHAEGLGPVNSAQPQKPDVHEELQKPGRNEELQRPGSNADQQNSDSDELYDGVQKPDGNAEQLRTGTNAKEHSIDNAIDSGPQQKPDSKVDQQNPDCREELQNPDSNLQQQHNPDTIEHQHEADSSANPQTPVSNADPVEKLHKPDLVIEVHPIEPVKPDDPSKVEKKQPMKKRSFWSWLKHLVCCDHPSVKC